LTGQLQDALDQFLRVKGLDDQAVGSDGPQTLFDFLPTALHRVVDARHQQDRGVGHQDPVGILPEGLADLESVDFRQAGVGQDHVRTLRADLFEGLATGAGHDDLDGLSLEGQLDDALDGRTPVGQEYFNPLHPVHSCLPRRVAVALGNRPTTGDGGRIHIS